MIHLEGSLDDDGIKQLRDQIVALRKQKSMRLLVNGKKLERISSYQLELISNPIRIYREMMGVVAFAEFSEPTLQKVKRTSWYRYLNIFKTEEEAKTFLRPRK